MIFAVLFFILTVSVAPALTPLLAMALPLIITAIAGWLSSARLNPLVNDAIVIVVFAACIAAAVYGGFLAGQLTGSTVLDVSLLGAYAALVMQLPAMKALLALFTLKLPSPLSLLAPPVAPKAPDVQAGGGGSGPAPVSGGTMSQAQLSAIPRRATATLRPTTLQRLPSYAVDEQATMPTGIVRIVKNSENVLSQAGQGAAGNDVSGG